MFFVLLCIIYIQGKKRGGVAEGAENNEYNKQHDVEPAMFLFGRGGKLLYYYCVVPITATYVVFGERKKGERKGWVVSSTPIISVTGLAWGVGCVW